MVSEMVKSGKFCATEVISPENEQGETVTVPSYDGRVSGKLLLLILCVEKMENQSSRCIYCTITTLNHLMFHYTL